MIRRLLLVLVSVMLLGPSGAALAAPEGALTGLPGTGGCVTSDGASDDGPGTCLADPAIDTGENQDSAIVAPDGRFVYLADERGRLLMYGRDTATGLLSIPGGVRCWDDAGAAGCADYRGSVSGDGNTIVISGDGRFLYATDLESASGALLVFSRDTATGELTQLAGTAGCLSRDGGGEAGPGTCADIRGINTPNAITLSADERFAYVTDFSGRLLAFARDAATGVVSQLPGTQGCIDKDGASEDGAGTCQNGRLTSDGRTAAIAPDGRRAYMADLIRRGVEVFDRDPVTGVLTVRTDQASCITQSGSVEGNPNGCLDGRALDAAYQVAVSRDGRTLYVSGESPAGGGVAVLRVDPATGALSQPAGTDGCVTFTGTDGDSGTTCRAAPGTGNTYGMVTSPDGRTLYALGRGGPTGVLSIDQSTGLVAPLPGTAGCLSGDGKDSTLAAGTCTDARALDGAYSMAFDRDGAFAYAADINRHSLSAFRREAVPACTNVNATASFQTPVNLTLTCRDPNGDPLTRQVATGPIGGSLGAIDAAGTALFTPATGFTGAASFSFTATDASGTSEPATATVSVGAGPPAQPAAAGDRTKPKVRVTKARLTAKGVALTLSLSEAARVSATLKGRLGKSRKAKTLASGTGDAKRAGTFTLVLKPAKATRKSLLGLSGKRLKSFRGSLSVTATDAAKNRVTASVKALKLAR